MMNKRLNGIDWLPNFQIAWLACTLQLNLWRRWDLGAGVSPTRQHWILELGPLRFLYERNERPVVESDCWKRKDPHWLPKLIEAYGNGATVRFKLYGELYVNGRISAFRLSKNIWDGLVVVRGASHESKSAELNFEQIVDLEEPNDGKA